MSAIKEHYHDEIETGQRNAVIDEILEQDKILSAIKTEPCKKHKPHKLSYLEWTEYAENKIKHGAKQHRCNICGYWFFKSEM
jgi:hypothetical protein